MAENTLQVKRALSTSARTAITPAVGEPIWDTEEEALYIGDGLTAGGKAAVDGTGVSPQQTSRLNAVDYRAKKPMHQTTKLVNCAHWGNNLQAILGSGFANDDHHVREGLYCLRTKNGATGAWYYVAEFYLPPHVFVRNEVIDIFATFDFPNPPGNVGFQLALLVDPDSSTINTTTSKIMGLAVCNDTGNYHPRYVGNALTNHTHDENGSTTDPPTLDASQDDPFITAPFDSADLVEIHMRVQAHGHKYQSATNVRARKYPKAAVNGYGTIMTAEDRRWPSSFDFGVGHRCAIGVFNTSGDIDGVTGTSSSTNYEELRLMSLSAFLTGWNRSN